MKTVITAKLKLLNGCMAIKVDAHYTSKACPMCGHTCDANQPKKGLLFVCQNCQYTLHADLVGARNLVMRTLVVRQDWMTTGQVTTAPGSLDGPDVSANEAKAARYAVLRWMPEASPRSSDGVFDMSLDIRIAVAKSYHQPMSGRGAWYSTEATSLVIPLLG